MSLLLRVLVAVAGRLPWGALRAFGAALGWVAGSVLRVRRGQVERAMRTAGVDRPVAQARAMYRSLGTSALELLHVLGAGVDPAGHARIDPASQRRWDEALGAGRGVVVAASHTGNWDLAACAVAGRVELLVVTKRLSLRFLDDFWQGARAAKGVRLVEARGAMEQGRSVLRRGGAVAMMIDQVPDSARHAIDVEFLGQRALVDRAPAVLAAACGAPLLVAASRRDADGEHLLVVLDVLLPPPRRRGEWIHQATAAATRALDEFVRAHPSQWLWLHRRWRRPKYQGIRGRPGATIAAPCRNGPIRSSSPAAASRVA